MKQLQMQWNYTTQLKFPISISEHQNPQSTKKDSTTLHCKGSNFENVINVNLVPGLEWNGKLMIVVADTLTPSPLVWSGLMLERSSNTQKTLQSELGFNTRRLFKHWHFCSKWPQKNGEILGLGLQEAVGKSFLFFDCFSMFDLQYRLYR